MEQRKKNVLLSASIDASVEPQTLAKEKSLRIKGFMLAIFAATLWGVSGSFGQFLFQQKGVGVEWMITVRMLISGFILLLVSFTSDRASFFEIFKDKKDTRQLIFFSITGMLAVQYTYFAAISHSNAATATVLQFAGPVLIAIYQALKSKKMPAITEIIAVFLAVLGTFLLVTHGNTSTLTISKMALVMGLSSAVALAIYTLQPVKLLNKYSSITVVGWGMFIGGLAFSFVKAPWQVSGHWDLNTFLAAFFIIIFGTLLAFYAYLTAVKIIGGQKSSLLASAEPLSATIIAVVWMNVSFFAMDWIGSACIIATIFILSIGKK